MNKTDPCDLAGTIRFHEPKTTAATKTTMNTHCPSKLNKCPICGCCLNGNLQINEAPDNECTNHCALRVPPSNEFGLGASGFRDAMHTVADEYLQYAERVARGQEQVRAKVQPGYLRPLLPTEPPEEPTSLESLLGDFKKHLLPGV